MHFKFLSNDYPIEGSYFIIPRFCLTWMGQYPQRESSSPLRSLNSALHYLVLSTGVITQFWYGFYYLSADLQKGLDALCTASSCLVSLVKMFLICWYGKDLSGVINHLQNLLFTGNNDERKQIVRNSSAKANRLVLMVLALGMMANIFYGLRPLVVNMVRVMDGQEYIFDETPLKVMVPTITLRLPWYPLTYSLISYMTQVVVFAFSGVDGIFISFCLYSVALLQVLQKDLNRVVEKLGENTKLSMEENKICLYDLGKIVERHNEVIDLVKQFTGLFMWIILSHFVTSSLVLGASMIEILLHPGYPAIIYGSYALAVFSELFIFCYGGTEIIINSSEIGTTAYFTNWHSCDTQVQKTILMIIIRSQKPLTMNVPFFSPTLETFMSIVQTAGSFIAVVKTIL